MAPAVVDRGHRLRLHPDRIKELVLLGLLVLAVIVFGAVVDSYISGRFFNRVTTSVAVVVILAAAQSLVIITRNVDLSVGSIVGMAAYVTADLLQNVPGTPALVAVLVAMAVGAVLGAVNGALVAYGGVPAIIVTLGTLALFRTLVSFYADGQNVTADALPDWVIELNSAAVLSGGGFDLRTTFAVAVLVVLVLQWALARLRWGRRLYAIGSNPAAAAQAGLPASRLVFMAFVGSGTLAGLAGFVFMVRVGTISATAGSGLELESVAAAVVGGVSILGGSGTMIGALLGAVLIDTLRLSLVRVPQVSEFWRDAVLGLLVLLAVVADGLLNRRLARTGARHAAVEAAEAASADPSTGGRSSGGTGRTDGARPTEDAPAAPAPAGSPAGGDSTEREGHVDA